MKQEFLDLKQQWNTAYKLIKEVFKDKLDAGAHPYVDHPLRVMIQIENERDLHCEDKESSLALFYEKAIITAMLHDVVEDTEITLQDLKDKGFDEEIVQAVDAISRRKEEQYYFDFIERVKKNDIARLVKIKDLEDNMDIKRLNSFGDYEQKRLKKYWYCWKYLKGELGGLGAITCNNAIHPDRLMR